MIVIKIVGGIISLAIIAYILYLTNKIDKLNGLVKYWHSEYARDVPQLRADKSVVEAQNESLKLENTILETELSKLRKSKIPLEIEEINGEQKVFVYGSELPFVISVSKGEDIRVDNGFYLSDWDKNIIIELQIPEKNVKSDESLKCIEVVTE